MSSSFHCEQTWTNSCVPACMVIAERWRGRTVTEADFHKNAADRGHPIALAATLEHARRLVEDTIAALSIALQQDHVAIVTVCGPRWVVWLGNEYPALSSAHGPLCDAGEFGAPLHCLALIERLPGVFRLLDPWFPENGQPLDIKDDAFDRVWAGEAVVVPRN